MTIVLCAKTKASREEARRNQLIKWKRAELDRLWASCRGSRQFSTDAIGEGIRII